MINSEVDRKKFNDALQELSNSFTRIAAERDLIKEIVNNLSDVFQLPKKTVNKIARIHYKQNFTQEADDFAELEALYEEVITLVK